MKDEKIENLLAKLADATNEPVRSGLAEDIKRQMPHNFAQHKKGLETINIIIDFRINKLAAAAAIFITLILCFSLLGGGRDLSGADLLKEGQLIIKHLIGKDDLKKETLSIGLIRYKALVNQGENVVYYGNNTLKDSNSILMYWPLSDGNYRAMFADLRERTITPAELIELQTLMLQHQKR